MRNTLLSSSVASHSRKIKLRCEVGSNYSGFNINKGHSKCTESLLNKDCLIIKDIRSLGNSSKSSSSSSKVAGSAAGAATAMEAVQQRDMVDILGGGRGRDR